MEPEMPEIETERRLTTFGTRLESAATKNDLSQVQLAMANDLSQVQLAMANDLKTLRADMLNIRTDLVTDIKNAEIRLIKWVTGQIIAFLLAAIAATVAIIQSFLTM